MENFFATNLKYLRKKNGWTQDYVGKKIKKDYSTIGKYELGQRTPYMNEVLTLASLFNVTLEEFVTKDLKKENK